MAYAINLNADAAYVEQPSLFARLRQSFADYREYLATYEELNALSDRQLADMGISRLNIREIARAAVYGRLKPPCAEAPVE
jgi:uncharacterized protein YjiS (DUF1127 family)